MYTVPPNYSDSTEEVNNQTVWAENYGSFVYFYFYFYFMLSVHQSVLVFKNFASESLPGPLNMALIVPDVKACSLFTMNSCPSDEISFTYMASGPSQPP